MVKEGSEPNTHKMSFTEAFEKYVAGQTVVGDVFYPMPKNFEGEYFHGDGLELENGYKYVTYGGGCSGEDCNYIFIVDPDDNLVATKEW